ncbi:MAG: extracellular solute-binding protein [Treponema sp.]|nr:extracellular solute-binding protein [Treponema sp.]
MKFLPIKSIFKISFLFAFISVACIILACLIIYSSKSPVIIELGMFAGSNWNIANGDSYHTVDKAISIFEAAHPGVKVHYYSGIRKSDYDEWLSEQILSGKTPDVFLIPENRFMMLIKNGILKNLTPMIERDGVVKRWEYFAPSWVSGEFQGKQYALPYQTNYMLMAVNVTLLKKYGLDMPARDWTWNDFYNLSAKAGMYGYTWQNAVYSNGIQLFDETGNRAFFSDSRTVEAVRFMQRIKEHSGDRRFTASDFDAGKVAFMPMSYAQFCTYISYPYKVYKDFSYEWGCLPMPAGISGGNISEVNTLMLGINSRTKKLALSYELLKTLVHDLSVQTDVCRTGQGTSPLRIVSASQLPFNALDSSDKGSKDYIFGLSAEILGRGIAVPKFSLYAQAMASADSEIIRIIEDHQNADTALRLLQQNIQDLLAR